MSLKSNDRCVMAGLRAVIFDLGGTLIRTASPAEIIKKILEKYGIKRNIEEISSAHRFAEESVSPEDHGLSYYDFWIKWNKRILEKLRILDKNDFLAKVLVDEWWDNAGVEVYPDAEEVLVKLKRSGLKVGVITNAFEKDIEEIFRRVKLPITFDVLVGIDTVKKPKPSPEIFLYAVHTLKVLPHEAAYIGDDIEKDYVGAVSAGLRAVLIDRDSTYINRRDLIRVRSLSEVPELILRN
ncbi:MAG: HAD family hydrolase, partial [Candidatus Bathyarchaeia archaeon]